MKTDGDVKDFHWLETYVMEYWPLEASFSSHKKCSVDSIPNSCDVPAQRDTWSHLRTDLLPIYVVHSGICKVIAILFNSSGIYKQFPTMHTITRTHWAPPLGESKIAAGDWNLLDLGFLDALGSLGPGWSTDQYFLVVKIDSPLELVINFGSQHCIQHG